MPSDVDYKKIIEGVDPPGYMMKMVLRYFLGRRLPIGGDKSEWILPLFYEDCYFYIQDWKRYKWMIFGDKHTKETAKKMLKKLKSAITILNKSVKEEARKHFEVDDFFLQNNYYKTKALYEFYSSKTSLLITERENGKSILINSNNDFGNKKETAGYYQFDFSLQYNFITTTVYFFALTEVLLDVCFALGERNKLTYKQFRKLNWKERFKQYFDLKKTNINNIYNDLNYTRRYYRNYPIHAKPEFFFPFGEFGLIPSDFEDLYKPHMLEFIQFAPKEAKKRLKLYERTLKLFNKQGVKGYAKLFAESNLPIPILTQEASKWKTLMNSKTAFQKK